MKKQNNSCTGSYCLCKESLSHGMAGIVPKEILRSANVTTAGRLTSVDGSITVFLASHSVGEWANAYTLLELGVEEYVDADDEVGVGGSTIFTSLSLCLLPSLLMILTRAVLLT